MASDFTSSPITTSSDSCPQVLNGKLVLVTGAGQGNGQALAIGLARAGARVVVTDIDEENALSTAATIVSEGLHAVAYPLDVSDASQCNDLAQRVRQEAGLLDVLINNAGLYLRKGIDNPDAPEIWRRVIDVNLTGAFNVVHAFLPALRETRGNIINIASIAAFLGTANAIGYAPSKGGLKQFTQALANDLGEQGVRVNGIAPGLIRTQATAFSFTDAERFKSLMQRIPLRRPGEPHDLIGPVVFLASDMAAYVTGITLPVEGGWLAT